MRIETPVPVEEMDDEISVSASDLPDKTMRIITQNMLFGLVFIAVAIVLSGVGLISPIAAAFIHEFGAFFVIFNSARLLRFEGKQAVAQAERNSACGRIASIKRAALNDAESSRAIRDRSSVRTDSVLSVRDRHHPGAAH